MTKDIRMDMVFARSNDTVAREIDGALIIVPLTAGIGDMEDDLFSMNETGTAIWNMLDGRITMKEAIAALEEEYMAGPGEIERDVLGIVEELLKRRILVEAATA
jgi:hypothetical protein